MKIEPSPQWKRLALAEAERQLAQIQRVLAPVFHALFGVSVLFVFGWCHVNLLPDVPMAPFQMYVTFLSFAMIPVCTLMAVPSLFMERACKRRIAKLSE